MRIIPGDRNSGLERVPVELCLPLCIVFVRLHYLEPDFTLAETLVGQLVLDRLHLCYGT